MTIGLDLSSLQGAHRMRGIGYTLINFINNIPDDLKKKHSFVFYFYQDGGLDNPLDILKLEGLTYDVRTLKPTRRITTILPGRLNLFIRFLNQAISFIDIYWGDSRIKEVNGIDVFLQTDQAISLPRGKFKKMFIAYDVIPYVLEWDYLWNYKTARSHGLPRQAAIRCSIRRWMYIHKLRVNARRADKILTISDVTRDDFLKYVTRNKSKLVTVPLGINFPKEFTQINPPQMHHYISSSWGYLRRPFKFNPTTPYLLFVGGADKRRKLEDVVTAFNHLRAQGHELNLVLAGDSMQGPLNISTERIQKSLIESSYIDDIIFMGFVDDEQRDWLYKNALVFVFPSVYEGFGLPVLEALSYGCPVISYPNQATIEVADDTLLYVNNAHQLLNSVKTLLSSSQKQIQTRREEGLVQAIKYDWRKTSKKIINLLS